MLFEMSVFTSIMHSYKKQKHFPRFDTVYPGNSAL